MTYSSEFKKIYVLLFYAATVTASPAQTFNQWVVFDGFDGISPNSVVQGVDGNFYGTAIEGGSPGNNICPQEYGCGTAFMVNQQRQLKKLHDFCNQGGCPDGEEPGELILGVDGNFYGVTTLGGTGSGTAFKITPTGTLTTLQSFDGLNGDEPFGPLVQGTDGNFYGTTGLGGEGGAGAVFRMRPDGEITTLYSFDQYGPSGSSPNAGLVEATDGNFYGTAIFGGDPACNAPYGCGTVFKIKSNGNLTVLHKFEFSDGAWPNGGMVQAADGNLYGTAQSGGTNCPPPYGCGTIFKITPAGNLAVLHSFNQIDGNGPYAMVQGSDDNFYGITLQGGPGYGTAFEITPGGALTVLHGFDQSDGSPDGLMQATTGTFYGAASGGGFYRDGTLFSLDVGLGPFVSLIRDAAKVGDGEGILGQGFTGATKVSFHGTHAEFKAVSDTLIKAAVPAGATTGYVTVTTPSGTLKSNKPFRVTPQLLSFDPPSGPVGAQVTITGVSLTQTQGVGFGNQVPSQFTVNSDTQVTAIVPAGAKKGPIGIQTLGGKAISSTVFTVTQ